MNHAWNLIYVDSSWLHVDCTWDFGEILREATETSEGIIKYTCTVCGTEKEESIPVKIIVTITTQPKATTVVEGKTLTFKVAARTSNGSTLTYQWQYSKDAGKTWTTSAQKTGTYSITSKTTWNGWKYRCIITDSNGNTVTSAAATLTVK